MHATGTHSNVSDNRVKRGIAIFKSVGIAVLRLTQ